MPARAVPAAPGPGRAAAEGRGEGDKEALAGTAVSVAAGDEPVTEAALRPADIVMAAIAGTAGVRPTFAALAAGRTVALANKECLEAPLRARQRRLAPGCFRSIANTMQSFRRWGARRSVR
jgi:hypothetical protein